MSDQSRPDEIRGRSFGQARRGYDRDEVDQFRDDVAGQIEALLKRVAQLEAAGSALGIEDAESLRAELATVGEDVAEVLAAAQKAAEGLRSRAAADAATWRAQADKESRTRRKAAQKDAEKARGDAWATATELLTQVQETASDLRDRAAEDALFVRAEAEREALRLTGDARRDQEEIVRSARTEADRLVQSAHVEADQILESARQSADSAQERARALERRRTELMEELEAARLSIGQLEQEIDTRREALATAADTPDSGVRIVGSEEYGWTEDDSAVRLVPGHVVPIDEPVDADSLVAEVEALQRAIDAAVTVEEEPDQVLGDQATADQPVTDEPEVDEAEGDESDAVEVETAPPTDESTAAAGLHDDATVDGGAGEAAQAVAPVVDATDAEVAEDVEVGPTDEDRLDDADLAESLPAGERDGEAAPDPNQADTAPDEAAAEVATEADAPPTKRSRSLDGLFARLRSPDVEPEPGPPSDVAAESEITHDETEAAPTGASDEQSEARPAEAPSPSDSPAAAATSVDPFDLRDRMLLPIENRALRSVKRRIVDLQNRVLEELRVGGEDWAPDRAMLAAAVGDEMATLVAESHVAGHTAAADLTGSSSTPRPEEGPASNDTGPFVDALATAVSEALARARAAGGGSRQVSAGVSRVFRAWRTDEAERRLRQAARRSYHEGVIAGLEALGVERMMAVTDGHPCGRCPATSRAVWRPGHALPAGTSLPPATSDCNATVVPAGS